MCLQGLGTDRVIPSYPQTLFVWVLQEKFIIHWNNLLAHHKERNSSFVKEFEKTFLTFSPFLLRYGAVFELIFSTFQIFTRLGESLRLIEKFT